MGAKWRTDLNGAVLRGIDAGRPVKSWRDTVRMGQTSSFFGPGWLLDQRYLYAAVGGMLSLCAMLRDNNARWRLSPRAARFVTALFDAVNVITSALVLAGTLPVLLDAIGRHSTERLVCRRSPLLGASVDRWAVFFYLATLVGLLEPLLVVLRGREVKQPLQIYTVGMCLCARLVALTQTPHAMVFIVTHAAYRLLRSLSRQSRAFTSWGGLSVTSLLRSNQAVCVTNALLALPPIVMRSFRCLSEAQQVANGVVIAFSLLSFQFAPDLAVRPVRRGRTE
eukprot:CAMPEP_0198725444 /NCGR_PEP_ID=MMETSP1475-20131203/2755_1 /TAXON_ID= ORGANISM="Unidentified sp., Strain CCMP1999" /NCGR_SAMPLE_ID=MMETSP1475 /ASSEMBLY_ACC=CAM_ASM_001111 /LENGTH=279 /DNA_ID=CAMNT_0044487227 /DNA_START=42 /DNA_END=881 /DNA_ORIENTATION=-